MLDMKHNILVKFNSDVNYKEMIENIKNLFDELLTIEGIYDVTIYTNCIDRQNRYHLLIQIDMDIDVLPTYDESEVHKTWKDRYSKYIESKAIFDYE